MKGDGPTSIRFDVETINHIKETAGERGVSAWIRDVVGAEIENRRLPRDTRARLERVMRAFASTVVFARGVSPNDWGRRLQDGYDELLALYENAPRPETSAQRDQ